MTHEKLEEQIQGLLKAAEPLRKLDDDDPAKEELRGIVDQINRLRAKQEKLTQAQELAALSEPKAVQVDRGMLERRAHDLGLTFRANIGDVKLAEKIGAAMWPNDETKAKAAANNLLDQSGGIGEVIDARGSK